MLHTITEIDFNSLTDDFITKFDRSDLADFYNQAGLTEAQGLRETVIIQAAGYFVTYPKGQRIHAITSWYCSTRVRCEEIYDELRREHPNVSRQMLNEVPDVSRLNAVRSGLRAVMKYHQNL